MKTNKHSSKTKALKLVKLRYKLKHKYEFAQISCPNVEITFKTIT